MIEPARITRPHPSLLTYYAISSLALGPLFPLLLVPRAIRYSTLRYRFDDDGISVAWGVLFRREIHLTYDRIQDIHVRSNVVERWLGLARVPIQTASGSAAAEVTIEGVREYEALRDFVYGKMRGARRGAAAEPTSGGHGELAAALAAVADELREVRLALERRGRDG